MNPSVETLKRMSSEDWNQRYRNTYIKYDGKCNYIEGFETGVFLFTDLSEKPPEGEGEEIPTDDLIDDGTVRPGPQVRIFDPIRPGVRMDTRAVPRQILNIRGGLSKEDYITTVCKLRHGASWYMREINSRIFTDDILRYLAPENMELYFTTALWRQADIEVFRDLISLKGGNVVGVGGFQFIRDGMTIADKRQAMAECLAETFNAIFRNNRQLSLSINEEYEAYLENYPNPGVNARYIDIGCIPYIHQYERETRNVTMPPRARLRLTRVGIDVDKITLERPKSRWFLSDGKPVFIGYTNERQYKRGLVPQVAKLYTKIYPDIIKPITPTSVADGVRFYGDAYDFKDQDVVKRNITQVLDDLKVKGFCLLKPTFLVSKFKGVFYKNVKIGEIGKDNSIALSNIAFSQEIEELIYDPKIKSYYPQKMKTDDEEY